MLRFFTAFASLYFVSTLAHAQVIESQDKIRVRIFKARNEIFISGFGLRIQGEDLVIPNEILPKNKKLRVLRVPEGWSVTNISDPTQKDLYKGDRLRISGDLLKIENEAAAGDQLLIASGAKFDLISELDLEYYLKGVLPSEMPVQWPRESLKAQAVAARSYAMSIMAERSREPYHVDDTTHHQVFHLENYAGADLAAREKVEAAIAGTKGVYLTHSNGDPYKTFFHSDCGGSTEEPKFVWAVGEKNGTVKDERCAINPKSAWVTHIGQKELDQTFKKAMGINQSERVSAITVGSSTDSGRIHELLIHFQSADMSKLNAYSEVRALNSQDFRRLFGYDRVKSTNFELTFSDKGLDLKGRGHGHGAGMCQKGARFMALAGANFFDILKRYYPNARIKRPPVLAKGELSTHPKSVSN